MRFYYLIGRLLSPLMAAGFYVFNSLTGTKRARVVVTNEKDEILLVQTWLSGDIWSLPGGGIERNEASVEAARRELREETGIIANISLRQTGSLYAQAHTEIIFELKLKSTDLPSVIPNRFEIKAMTWFSPQALPKLGVVARQVIDNVAIQS